MSAYYHCVKLAQVMNNLNQLKNWKAMKLIAETNDNKAMEEMTDIDFIDCFRVSLYSPNSRQICLS